MSDGFEVAEEVAGVLSLDEWMLVGGLMVHAHALMVDVPNMRATDDTDIVVGVVAGTGYGVAVQALESLGFHFQPSLDERTPAYQFLRGTDRIDLMVPDRVDKVRHARRDVIQVPGSSSALKRTERFTTAGGVEMRVADLTGALSLKGAAYGLPSHDRLRHLQDAVVLFACGGHRTLRAPSKSERGNINQLLRDLEKIPEAWSLTDEVVRRRAVQGIWALRPDWVVPRFVLVQRMGRRNQ